MRPVVGGDPFSDKTGGAQHFLRDTAIQKGWAGVLFEVGCGMGWAEVGVMGVPSQSAVVSVLAACGGVRRQDYPFERRVPVRWGRRDANYAV